MIKYGKTSRNLTFSPYGRREQLRPAAERVVSAVGGTLVTLSVGTPIEQSSSLRREEVGRAQTDKKVRAQMIKFGRNPRISKFSAGGRSEQLCSQGGRGGHRREERWSNRKP